VQHTGRCGAIMYTVTVRKCTVKHTRDQKQVFSQQFEFTYILSFVVIVII